MNNSSLKTRLMMLLCMLSLSGGSLLPSYAQDARIITFEEAVRTALERNVDLRRAQTATELANVGVRDARAQFLPDLRLNTSAAENVGRNFNQSEGRIINESSEAVSLGLSSGMSLFDGFANSANLRGARLSAQASQSDLRRTQETVVFTVARNFLNLIQQQEQLRVRRENLAAENALAEQIETYVNAGARTIADLYQQRSSVASARLAVVQAEQAVELAMVDLMQTLQLDPAGTYQFEIPGAETLSNPAEPPSLDVLLRRAGQQRVDLRAQDARVAATEQDIRVARAERLPNLSLNASYGSAYTSATDFDFVDQLNQRRGGSIGLGFSIPLYDRGSTANATRRAELQAENARVSLESLQQQVGLQIRRAYLDHRAAREQFSASDAQQRAAQQALEAVEARYRAGAATLVELTQARAAQVQAASALVSARYNLLFQRTLMDYYSGDLQVPQ